MFGAFFELRAFWKTNRALYEAMHLLGVPVKITNRLWAVLVTPKIVGFHKIKEFARMFQATSAGKLKPEDVAPLICAEIAGAWDALALSAQDDDERRRARNLFQIANLAASNSALVILKGLTPEQVGEKIALTIAQRRDWYLARIEGRA